MSGTIKNPNAAEVSLLPLSSYNETSHRASPNTPKSAADNVCFIVPAKSVYSVSVLLLSMCKTLILYDVTPSYSDIAVPFSVKVKLMVCVPPSFRLTSNIRPLACGEATSRVMSCVIIFIEIPPSFNVYKKRGKPHSYPS